MGYASSFKSRNMLNPSPEIPGEGVSALPYEDDETRNSKWRNQLRTESQLHLTPKPTVFHRTHWPNHTCVFPHLEEGVSSSKVMECAVPVTLDSIGPPGHVGILEVV